MFDVVAPFAGAWIEIASATIRQPSCTDVAPFAGAWIEIVRKSVQQLRAGVAPFAGAWIEILVLCANFHRVQSLPSRERGLKLLIHRSIPPARGRSLRGSVD